MPNPQVIVEFITKVDDLKKGFTQAESSAESTGNKLKTFGKVAVAAAGAAGLAALTYTLHTGIQEFEDHAKAAAQTAAVIKSTGGLAHVTAQHVEDLAGSLLQVSGVDDEVIQSGENMLLTFRNIRNQAGKNNDIFDQATKATLDLSVAMGKDMQSSAILVGKALNDPVKGLTALTRVGVSFTQAQKDMIKNMVKSGDTIGAQKVILGELNKEFGGSAQAAGKTLPGQLAILRQNFNNLAGTLVQTVAPALGMIAKFFAENPTLAKAVTIGILALAAAMVALNVALAVTAVVTSPITLTIIGITAAVAALTVGIILLVTHFQEVVDWLKAHWDIAALVIAPFLIIPIEIAKHSDAIINAVRSIFDAAFNVVWNAGQGIVNTVKDAFSGAGTAIWQAFSSVFNPAWNLGQGIADGLAKGLAGAGQGVVNVITGIGSRIWQLFATVFNWGWQLGRHILDGAVSGVSGIGAAVWNVIKSIGGWIWGAFNTIWGWGQSIGNWIWDGIKGALSGIGNALINIIKAPINAVLSAWNALKIGAFTIPMPGPIPDIHFGGIGLPNIPYLAQGGFVMGPTVAVLGEAGPEMVVPLSAGNAPVEVHVYIGDQELRGMIRTEVVTAGNRTAQTLLAGLAR